MTKLTILTLQIGLFLSIVVFSSIRILSYSVNVFISNLINHS
jgi:hypothetical protein